MWNQYRLYVGANNETGKVEKAKLIKILDGRLMGYTLIDANGRWNGKNEKSIIVELNEEKQGRVERLIADICLELKQEAVGMQVLPSVTFVSK